MATPYGRLLVLGLLALALTGTAQAQAQTQAIPTFRLLHPADVQNVTLSPSGDRLAALTVNPDGNGLIVMQRRNGSLSPLLGNRLGNNRSFTGYRWLTNDYLLLGYFDYTNAVAQSVLVDVPTRSVHYLNSLVRVLKLPWGDSDHVLLSSTGQDCPSAPTVAVTCLLSLDLAGGTTREISDGLTLLPLDFVAVSPSEIYAKGRDTAGAQHEYQLNASTRAWRSLPDGSFDRQQQQEQQGLRQTLQPTDAELNAAARTGMHRVNPVRAQPSGKTVALLGYAPERAMVAVDSRLDGIDALMQGQLAGERVSMSGLNDQLTTGLLTVWDTDRPARYLFLTDSGVHEYAPLAVQFDVTGLGRTHIERSWVPGVAVSVTMPPAGVSLTGALVEPLTARQAEDEEPLHNYQGELQVLALHGLAVVRVLAPLPDSFPDNAAGAIWRRALKSTVQTVVAHVSHDLLQDRDVCLYGERTGAQLALALGDVPHVGCVIAINPMLNPRDATRTQVRDVSTNTALDISVSEQELQSDVPAAFGSADGGGLVDTVAWANALPSRVMLAFNTSITGIVNYAEDSAAFRAAAGRAGKAVTYYAPDVAYQNPDTGEVNLVNAVADYATHYFAGTSAVANR